MNGWTDLTERGRTPASLKRSSKRRDPRAAFYGRVDVYDAGEIRAEARAAGLRVGTYIAVRAVASFGFRLSFRSLPDGAMDAWSHGRIVWLGTLVYVTVVMMPHMRYYDALLRRSELRADSFP